MVLSLSWDFHSAPTSNDTFSIAASHPKQRLSIPPTLYHSSWWGHCHGREGHCTLHWAGRRYLTLQLGKTVPLCAPAAAGLQGRQFPHTSLSTLLHGRLHRHHLLRAYFYVATWHFTRRFSSCHIYAHRQLAPSHYLFHLQAMPKTLYAVCTSYLSVVEHTYLHGCFFADCSGLLRKEESMLPLSSNTSLYLLILLPCSVVAIPGFTLYSSPQCGSAIHILLPTLVIHTAFKYSDIFSWFWFSLAPTLPSTTYSFALRCPCYPQQFCLPPQPPAAPVCRLTHRRAHHIIYSLASLAPYVPLSLRHRITRVNVATTTT